jgi:dynein heavy chain
VVERRKYGPLGWNIPYEFNDTDMDITAAQLELYVSSYAEIPYKVLQQLTSVVNYGGRITDDKDMRTSDILIADFFNPKILSDEYKFSPSGLYASISADPDAPHKAYIDYIEGFPLNAEPEVFGMHDNANITCAITEIDATFGIILALQPRVSGGTGISREDYIIEMCKDMARQLVQQYDVEAIGLLYPTDYHESFNTVLVQEAQRYNRLIEGKHKLKKLFFTVSRLLDKLSSYLCKPLSPLVMHISLRELQRALKGLVVLSADLEAMGNACFDQRYVFVCHKSDCLMYIIITDIFFPLT